MMSSDSNKIILNSITELKLVLDKMYNVDDYENYIDNLDILENTFVNRNNWLLHYNVQGLLSFTKLTELQMFVNKFPIKVISLNEHWLNSSQLSNLNTFECFVLASHYIRVSSTRGGSCILVKKGTQFIERNDLIVSLKEDFVFESCCIAIPNESQLVISIYHNTNKSNVDGFLIKLEKLFKALKRESKRNHVYITSDFNIDILESCRDYNLRNRFLNLLISYGYTYNFKMPTRVTKETMSCIDNIITNNRVKQSKLLNIELGLSDHRALLISVDCKNDFTAQKGSTRKRIFTAQNIAGMVDCISNTSWNVCQLSTVQENFNSFLSSFKTCFESSFPYKSVKAKCGSKNILKNKRWITNGIIESSKKKRELHKIAKSSNDVNFIQYVKDYKHIFKKVCTAAKRMYNCKYISDSKNKSKAVWHVVKSELGISTTKKQDCTRLKIKDEICVDTKHIAHHLNIMFVNTTYKISANPQINSAIQLLSNFNCNKQASFVFKNVSAQEVHRVIMSLRNTKSVAWDEIPVQVLKASALYISQPLALIVNHSFMCGQFPSQLKYADVIPVFKKGERQDPNNYRPVSILPSISKVFEKIAHKQLCTYLENNGFLCKNQYGFRSGHSTIEAASEMIEQILEALDGSQDTAGIFCDLSKAFDCVNHSLLVSKLKFYGILGKPLEWFQSFLTDRKQRILLNNNGINIHHHGQTYVVVYHKDLFWVLYYLLFLKMICLIMLKII
ncbi:uncharacterized protein LOC124364198 [Homalodisca vitripennis]|uniref:uncharacterized protein LOC124364198 n=1 Tax=Homalodisca vitripennis TaxID=197043 RepID=UPI001EEAB4CB|nr:uncharacterized protein LOC124364198 [Homalodisca vitripennis]